VNLVRLMQVPDLVDNPTLKFPAFVPGVPSNWRQVPIVQSHPERRRPAAPSVSIVQPVIDFLEQSVDDPSVVRDQADRVPHRHRLGSDEVPDRRRAARKEVTVVVELLARFDEEANLNWAAKLEEVGAQRGVRRVGYKTHAKMSLVVRAKRAGCGATRTFPPGNYHPRTARLYTDFGLLTADEKICEDVNEVFKQLTGLGRARRLHHLWISPFSLHRARACGDQAGSQPRACPQARAHHRENERPDRTQVIETLYRASQAGVKIDLIVRGVCSLASRNPGLSENIRVRSIIGRFLEHSRIFYFLNGGETTSTSRAPTGWDAISSGESIVASSDRQLFVGGKEREQAALRRARYRPRDVLL